MNSFRLRRVIGIVLVVVAAGVVSVAIATGASNPDARVVACGNAPDRKMVAVFDLPRARDVWVHVPGLAGAPELGTDDPVSVVIFDGPITVKYPGNPNEYGAASNVEQTVTNIVCVVSAGVPTYYANIDLAGWAP